MITFPVCAIRPENNEEPVAALMLLLLYYCSKHKLTMAHI